ncbi:MAG TPA: hypothetical protein VNN10_08030 [Dehalococcoidia bacterium]|nr:hypothetical protein [Dehalococcoidia bacterium]
MQRYGRAAGQDRGQATFSFEVAAVFTLAVLIFALTFFEVEPGRYYQTLLGVAETLRGLL